MNDQELITEIADYLWDGKSNNRALREDIAICIKRIRQHDKARYVEAIDKQRLQQRMRLKRLLHSSERVSLVDMAYNDSIAAIEGASDD